MMFACPEMRYLDLAVCGNIVGESVAAASGGVALSAVETLGFSGIV